MFTFPQDSAKKAGAVKVSADGNDFFVPVEIAGKAKEPFSGSATMVKTFTSPMNGFVISNDGSADLTFTIGSDTYTVKAGEVFEESFEPFVQVTVTTTVPFRAYGRGYAATVVEDTTAPINVTGLQATNITHNSVDLTWTASSSGDVAGYDIYNGSTLVTTVTGSSYQVTGLTAATQYTFSVRAKDSSGNVASGVNVTATTAAAPDTTAPTNVTNLAASNVTETTVDLSWTAATDDVGVNGYQVLNGSTLITTVAGTSYQVTGLTQGTQYTFTVKAMDAAGNTASGASVTVTTVVSSDTTAPSAVTNLAAANTTQTSTDLSWTAATDNVGVTGYNVYRDGDLLTTVSGTTYQVTGLTAGTTYSLSVRARDAAGNLGASVAVSVTTAAASDTTPPNEVTGLSATPGETTVDLSWTASTSSDIAGYNVYDGATKKNGSLITGTTYQVTGLTASTAYTFTVKAVDASSNESTGVQVSTTTTAASGGGVATSGLMLWYDGRDGSGTQKTWTDRNNNTYPGTLSFNTFNASNGWIGNGLKGTRDFGGEVTTNATITTKSYTLEFFIRFDGTPVSNDTVISQRVGTTNEAFVINHSSSSTVLYFKRIRAGGGTLSHVVLNNYTVGQMYHVVFVATEVDANNMNYKAYVDGVKTLDVNEAYNVALTATNKITLFNTPELAHRGNMTIYSTRVYSRAITESEITSNYNYEKTVVRS